MNNEKLQKLRSSDEYHKTCLRESLSYICFSIANQLREENDEWLRSEGLMVYDVNMLSNMATKAFNRYDTALKQMLLTDMKTQLCEDYEKVRKALYVFAGLEENDKNTEN